MRLHRGLLLIAFGLTACGGARPPGLPASGPSDLAVGVHAPDRVRAGDPVDVQVEVSNLGSFTGTYSVWVKLVHEGNGETPYTSDGVDWATVEPHRTATHGFRLHPSPQLPAGTYRIVAELHGLDDPAPSNDRATRAVTLDGESCSPDAWEDDDVEAAATPLVQGAPQAHTLCFDETDWFAIESTAGQRFGIRLEADGGLAQGELFAPGSADSRTVGSQPPGDPGFETVTPTASGTWRLKVSTIGDPGAGRGYRVSLLPDLPDWVLGDTSVPGDPVPVGSIFWYALRLHNDGLSRPSVPPVAVYLSSDAVPSSDDRRVALETVEVKGRDTQGFEHIAVGVPGDVAPGTWWIWSEVDPDDVDVELDETNDRSTPLAITVGAAVCAGDAYEQDDRPELAAPIALNEVQRHDHCDDDDDWLRFEAEAGRDYRIDITQPDWPYDGSELYVALVDPVGDHPLRAASPSGRAFTALVSGPHLLLVSAPWTGGTGGTYTVTVGLDLPDVVGEVTWVPKSATAGSLIRPDLGVDTTTPVRPTSVETALFLSSDPVLDEGDLRLGGCTLGLQRSEGPEYCPDYPTFAIPTETPPGTWYLIPVADPDDRLVERNEENNAGAAAPLVIGAPRCAVDSREDDDTLATATPLTLPATVTGNHCDDTDDFLAVDLAAGDPLVVDVASYGTDAVPEVEVYRPGQTVPVSSVYLQQGVLDYEAKESGTHGVRIGTTAPVRGPDVGYTVEVAVCPYDAADPVAYLPIAPGDHLDLNLCHGAWDFFSLPNGKGVTLTATAAPGARISPVIFYRAAGTSTFSGGTSTVTLRNTGDLELRVNDDDADGRADWGLASGYTLTVQ